MDCHPYEGEKFYPVETRFFSGTELVMNES
jgi:hypothetical protein